MFLQAASNATGIEDALLEKGALGLMLLIALVGLVYFVRRMDDITERFIASLREGRDAEMKRATENSAALASVSDAMREVKDGFREGFAQLNEQSNARHAEVLRAIGGKRE